MTQDKLPSWLSLFPGLFCILFGLLILGLLKRDYQQERDFDREGVLTKANIIESRVGSVRGNEIYELQYQYYVDGRPYYNWGSVSEETYRNVDTSIAHPILYLPDNPTISRLVEDGLSHNYMPLLIVLGLFGIILIGGGLALIGYGFWLSEQPQDSVTTATIRRSLPKEYYFRED